jgi:hypothetical protein
MQTVDITLPISSLLFQSIQARPVPPVEIQEEFMAEWSCTEAARICTSDNVFYTWMRHGDVFVDYPDGRKEIFWAKPTLSWAIRHKETSCRAPFFQFHSKGSVTCRAFGLTYFWDNDPVDAPLIEGTRIYGRHISDDTLNGWYFENDPEFYDDDTGYETSYYSDCDNMEEHRRRRCSSWSDD